MVDKIDTRAASGILYGVYKALYGLVGDNAAAVMRKAAPDILDELGKLVWISRVSTMWTNSPRN